MLSAAEVSIRPNISSPTTPASTPWRASRNENSPAWAISTPARTADLIGMPPMNDRPAMMAPFTGTISTTASRIRPIEATTKRGSTNIPIDTKKSPANTSRTGASSPSTWWLMSDSLMSMPGQESAQRERQPEQLRHVGGAEGYRHRGQDEHLAAAQHDHPFEEPWQHLQAERQQDRQEQSGLGDRKEDVAGEIAAQRQRAKQDNQHDCRQVLQRRPAQGHVAVGRIELAALAEDLGHHGTRRLRDESAEEQRFEGAEAQRDPHEVADDDHGHDLHAAADDGHLADAQQLPERQLEPDAEQQEHEADVGQRGDRLGLGNGPGRVRADDHAGHDVTQDRRLSEPDRDCAADGRCDQGESERYEDSGVGQGHLLRGPAPVGEHGNRTGWHTAARSRGQVRGD